MCDVFYCSDNGLEYMTDSTNLTEDYTRNKIRHTLLPYIQKEFNTSFIKTVTENACLIKDDSDYLDGIAEDFYKHHIRNCAVSSDTFVSFAIWGISAFNTKHTIPNFFEKFSAKSSSLFASSPLMP